MKTIILLILIIVSHSSKAQKISVKDSIDGKFDLSDYIIDAHGFIPVPYIITEPALGGFGGAIIPVFIAKNPPYIDTVDGIAVRTPVAPNVTGGIGLYTVNNTWALFGFRSGTFVKSRIKYLIAGGYSNINMSFYRTFEQIGEKELKFNLKAFPFVVQAIKRLGRTHWYAGLRYAFLKTETDFIGHEGLDSLGSAFESSSIVSQLGSIVELDTRDNIFTPDRGMKIHLDVLRSDDIFGSDHDFWRVNAYTYMYAPLSKKLVGGLRLESQAVSGELPFYMKPYISMRGIPVERYQGNTTFLSEGEFRWDVVYRWSVMLFGGTGKAFDEDENSNWIWSYGTGFRYLLARKFKLRVGIDIAHGPDTWAYYIVFGSNWVK